MEIGMGNSLLDRFRSLFVVCEPSAAADAAQALPRLKQINQRKANQSCEEGSEVTVTGHSLEGDCHHDNHGVAHWTFNSDKMIRQIVRRSDQLNGVAAGFEVDPH
jgi:hypothetical protein